MKISGSLNVVVAAIAAGLAMQAAVAQSTDKNAIAAEKSALSANKGVNSSDRERMGNWRSEQEVLERKLKVGTSKADYLKILSDNGYTVTAITRDAIDGVEYEVVKGDQSFEVEIDLDNGVGRKVEVGTNLWRAEATEAAMRDGKASTASKPLSDGERYSDRANRKGWNDQKEMLEKRLVTGKNLAFYTGELKAMGYQITSTNDRDRNYVEYEIVKGRNSYEVQMDRNDAGIVREVDVTTNMWQTEATERALGQQK